MIIMNTGDNQTHGATPIKWVMRGLTSVNVRLFIDEYNVSLGHACVMHMAFVVGGSRRMHEIVQENEWKFGILNKGE